MGKRGGERCCQRYQRYVNESNSQLIETYVEIAVRCCQRYQRYVNESNSQRKYGFDVNDEGCCQRYQRYVNESNSQLDGVRLTDLRVVVSGIKDT